MSRTTSLVHLRPRRDGPFLHRNREASTKLRPAYYVILSNGTTFFGDCPTWAAKARALGMRVVPVRYAGRRHRCWERECDGRHAR